MPKGRDGQVEAIRALMVAKRTARSERIQTINQARSLIVTGPDDLRARFAGHSADGLVAELASLRPRPSSMIRYHTLLSLAGLRRRDLGDLGPSRPVGTIRDRIVAYARDDFGPSQQATARGTAQTPGTTDRNMPKQPPDQTCITG